ncbi:MAG: LysM peptidoglycan-binding domain-containing protein [Gloeotrichia echinulata DEX184]
MSVTFTEYLKPLDDQRQTDPELTTHIVKRGDTLSSIAAQLYRDPRRWRIIAEANNLDDPRHLEIGTTLSIPEPR